jgi:hypothetical protein
VFCLVPPYVVCVDLTGLCHSRQEHLQGGGGGGYCRVKSVTSTKGIMTEMFDNQVDLQFNMSFMYRGWGSTVFIFLNCYVW